MKWFLAFLLMTMVGFGMAFYALYRQDRDKFVVRSLAVCSATWQRHAGPRRHRADRQRPAPSL